MSIKHANMLQDKLQKVESEFSEYVLAQAAKTDAAVSLWVKKVDKLREEKDSESERLRREVDTWKERGLEAERKRSVLFLLSSFYLLFLLFLSSFSLSYRIFFNLY